MTEKKKQEQEGFEFFTTSSLGLGRAVFEKATHRVRQGTVSL